MEEVIKENKNLWDGEESIFYSSYINEELNDFLLDMRKYPVLEDTTINKQQFLEKILGEKAEKIIMGIVLVFSLAISIG